MAFSKTPTMDTYSSQQLQMMFDLQLVPTVTDLASQRRLAGALNVLPFKDANGNIYGETRDGIQALTIDWPNDAAHLGMIKPGAQAIVRGMYVWEWDPGFATYFVVINDVNNSRILVWEQTPLSPTVGTWAVSATLAVAGTTPCRFCEFTDSATGNRSICMSDGTDLYVKTFGGAWNRCLDPQMPTPHVPFPVFIDGYLFLAKKNTADIYNSDLGNPSLWTAGNFITAEMFPDDIKALVKVDNYLLAIGNDTSEYFYDAGNATGSPLARMESATLPFGCVWPNTIAYLKNTVMMLANKGSGEHSYVVIEGFKHAEFPARAVLSALREKLTGVTDTRLTGDTLRSGFFYKNGQLFYFLAFDGTKYDTGWTDETLVASLECKMWARTRCDLYNAGTPTGQYGFPMLFTGNTSRDKAYTYIAGQMSVTGKVFFGTLSPLSKFDMLDAFNQYNIYQSMTIPPNNFGTMNRKTMHRLGVNYEVLTDVASNFTTGIKVSWSDDFGQTWLGNRALDGNTIVDQGYPFITQLGSFRSRALKIEAQSNRILWYSVEVDINKGMQ